MKIFVKTLKGSQFDIQVNPHDSVADVKRSIETAQGSDVYPAAQQMLIYQGKVLKDGTTLIENNVAENSFCVIMLSKPKSSPGDGSTTSTTAAPKPKSSPGDGSTTSTTAAPKAIQTSAAPPSVPASAVTQSPAPTLAAPAPAPAAVVAPAPLATAGSEANVYDSAASNLVAGSNIEGAVQQILDMGGGTWDRDTVIRALRAAYNNPERAVEYLYSGIPEQAEAPAVAPSPPSAEDATPPGQLPPAAAQPLPIASTGPNANPLDLFPQGLPDMGSNASGAGNLDFLRNNQQFQSLRAMVQSNPQILQPMLQELGKQNPHLMRLIQEHQADFLQLINEPIEGGENLVGQPQAISVTPEERDAIERLEAMGFDRDLVLEVFFACNKNEELAANYLLDHMNEFE